MTPTSRLGRRLGFRSLVVVGACAAACSSADDENVTRATMQRAVGAPTGIIKGLAGKCLDSGGTDNNARARLWQCNGAITQQWTVSDGQILGPNGKCLDAARNVSDDGTPLVLFDCWGGPNQHWEFRGNAIVGLGGKCVDVTWAKKANGTPIELWTCHGGANQQWTFVPGPGSADAGTEVADASADASDASSVSNAPDASPAPDAGAPVVSTRDPLAWPFASTSIWNMPIGSGAVFADANLSPDPEGDVWAPMPQIDDEVIVLRPSAPMTTIDYSSAGWSGADRCYATGGALTSVPMPSDYVVPNSLGNLGAAFLMNDGHTIRQLQPLARCTPGGHGTALVTFPDVDLFGDGIRGAHGGSGMSSIGGALRMGELRPGGTAPRHALKVDVDSPIELHSCPSFSDCYRWPAVTADSGANWSYGSRNANASPAMKMGALLAIPGSVSLASLGFETEPGKMLAWTFQNYGAYIVDTTGGASFTISAATGPDGSFRDQFANDWGFPLEERVRDATPWVRDIQRIRALLRVVDNNGPTSVGGGGTPRQPLAPAL